ncbi:MAG: SpoIIE family protein phosphatase [Gaiella sp.]|nr:SpoIIE family protein phosphatase [Gaiella sp.]
MRKRVAAPILVGGSLVALVAVATCAVAWLLWVRAEERGRTQDDRAAQATGEKLQNSVGRVLTSLRTSAGLVDARGNVDVASFQAWARAVGSIGATDALALAKVVPAAARGRFEAETGRRITELSESGAFRGARERATYMPIVAVWPDPGQRGALLGFDLMSDPVRSAALERSQSERRTAFTGVVSFLTEGSGHQAFRPVYAPGREGEAPVAFVSAWFGRERIASVFGDLDPDVRARVTFGGTEVFATAEAPATGAVSSLDLGGRTWVVTARGEEVSHASALAVLLGGAVLAVMLAVFTTARIASERRLRRTHEAERTARERSELLERNTSTLRGLAASLSAAALPAEVAEAVVPYLFETFDARLATVGVAHGDDVRTLNAVAGTTRAEWHWRPIPMSASSPTTDAMRLGRVVELEGWSRIRERYPGEVEQLLAGVETIHVVPLSGSRGALGIAFVEPRRLTEEERRMLDSVAGELTRALDRANLLESERDARLQAEVMERNAESLAAAKTASEVAAATVSEIEAFGASAVFVWALGDGRSLEALAMSALPEETAGRFGTYPLELGGLVSDAMKSRSLVTIGSGEEYDERYPELREERRTLGLESLVALPLRGARGEVIGAIFAAAQRPGWSTADRRRLLLGIAEQTGVALERAWLQAEAERVAESDAFLAALGESLERATTVSARARRLVEALAEGHATFAAVHLAGDGEDTEEIATAGSLPDELAGDERWAGWIRHVIETGETASADELGSRSDGSSSSLLFVPLRARGRSLGALTVRAAAGADWNPVVTRADAREIASRAALALDNAFLYERERDVSHALQLGLLGGALPIFEGTVVASAYRPGTATLEVGGDWYDAFRLESGEIALVVGDVVGHGLEAAVAMGQLRGAVSALAQSSDPARLLQRLDAFVETVPSAATATLAYVELDPTTGEARYACAGHPPPLVLSPDGSTRFLWDGRSAPLGSLLGQDRDAAVDSLEEGETLVLYTDGLVERRTASIDVGLERLADAARRRPLGAPRLADEICDALLDGQSQDDDVCVLTLFRIPTVEVFSHSFPAAPVELAGLRERLRGWLEESGVPEDVERGVVLAVSEAAANAVEHGYHCDGDGLVTVMARHAGGSLELTVRDEGTWREGPRTTDRGRGLEIIRALVEELTIDREDGATVCRMRTGASESTAS